MCVFADDTVTQNRVFDYCVVRDRNVGSDNRVLDPRAVADGTPAVERPIRRWRGRNYACPTDDDSFSTALRACRNPPHWNRFDFELRARTKHQLHRIGEVVFTFELDVARDELFDGIQNRLPVVEIVHAERPRGWKPRLSVSRRTW